MCIANRPKIVACFTIFLACLTSINVCIWSKHGFTFGMFVPIYELVHRWSEVFPASVERIFRANRRCFSRLSTFWAPTHSTFVVQQTTKTLSNLHGCFQQPQQIIEPTFLRTQNIFHVLIIIQAKAGTGLQLTNCFFCSYEFNIDKIMPNKNLGPLNGCYMISCNQYLSFSQYCI